MPVVFNLIGSVIVCILTVVFSVSLIRKKKLPKLLNWFKRRDVWKSYDFVWYGSGLLALTAFWLAQVEQGHRSELDDLSALMQRDASTVEGAVRAASTYCGTTNFANDPDSQIFKICIWVNGTHGSILSQGTNALYPTVPINQTVQSIDTLSVGSENIKMAGLKNITLTWTTVATQLYDAIYELHKLAKTDGSRYLLPNPKGLPNGVIMDDRLNKIAKLRTEIIPGSSPLNIQGTWWLYVFAFLIGLKMSKTYAELKLS